MRKVILAVLAVAMSLTMLACAAGTSGSARANRGDGIELAMGVEDLPCSQVREDVRRALEKDPFLGLTKDEKSPRGRLFHLPPKAEFLGSALRWSARVQVQCLAPTSSKVSVLVSLGDQAPAAGRQRVELESRIVKYVLTRLMERMHPEKGKP